MVARRTAAFFALPFLLWTHCANAASTVVVAIGGGNTAGKGVERDAAYPARLQEMLRARGYDIRVLNAGQPGDDSGSMLGRLNFAVPLRTDVVIVEQSGLSVPAGLSARDHADNMALIDLRLALRDIAIVHIDQVLAGITTTNIQPDAAHLNDAGHAIVARRLVPLVIGAIRKRKSATQSGR